MVPKDSNNGDPKIRSSRSTWRPSCSMYCIPSAPSFAGDVESCNLEATNGGGWRIRVHYLTALRGRPNIQEGVIRQLNCIACFFCRQWFHFPFFAIRDVNLVTNPYPKTRSAQVWKDKTGIIESVFLLQMRINTATDNAYTYWKSDQHKTQWVGNLPEIPTASQQLSSLLSAQPNLACILFFSESKFPTKAEGW